MLRAGPFSDERVIGLLNRRFVSFFFDLSDRGFAGDPAAREFVTKIKRDLRGSSVGTPPVLLVTPDGELAGEFSNYATEAQVLAALQQALAKFPELARPSAAEQALQDDVEKAMLHLDLGEDDAARACLLRAVDREPQRERASYELGRLARRHQDYAAMDHRFAAVASAELADDVRVERALAAWQRADFDAMRLQLDDFPKASNRYSEARYLAGLERFHADDKPAAQRIWAAMIGGCSQDPFVYRADWAYANSKREGRSGMTTFRSGQKGSPLGRIGYMGRDNPDLQKRSPR